MDADWFKPRKYRHFDRPVGVSFLSKAMDPIYVGGHSFSPLIHYRDETKRYRPKEHKTTPKPRPLMYTSHRDSAILSWYSRQLVLLLEEYYKATGLSECAIAYRALGKANYDFAAEAHSFAVANSPCAILAFDVTGFFDNLSHIKLKARLKQLLGVDELPADWYNVFRAVTRFRFVGLQELKSHPKLEDRFLKPAGTPIATLSELKDLAVPLHANGQQITPPRSPNAEGIPQGTPISAAMSNAYMIEFDLSLKTFCDSIGALYRRYSDDILIICRELHTAAAQDKVRSSLQTEGLQLSEHKTETTRFEAHSVIGSTRSAQYLGFMYYPGGAGLRPSSLSRQWRKMRRAVNRATSTARKGNGTLHTKTLRKRFTLIFDQSQQRPLRSFPAYAKRSAEAFAKGEKISRQALRLQRAFEHHIRAARDDLKK